MKKIVVLGLIGYLILLIFTRFYNVSYTARFTQDESGFLVRAHQIYEEKKLTLVGQVNEQGKVFGSLTVYLLLPFAILGNFDPRAMFYGAAFWGVVTAIVLLWLSYKINPQLIIPTSLLTIFFFPLLQTGRWAWNPNFVPLWIGLGIIFYLIKRSWGMALAGICLGLAVHHHYYAIFAGSFFALLIGFESLVSKKPLGTVLAWSGYFFTLLPFIIFDLRHPPGLFFLGVSRQSQSLGLNQTFFSDTVQLLEYFTQSETLMFCLLILVIGLFFFDLKKRSKALIFFLPIIFQRLMLFIVAPFFFHYYLAIIPFLIAWIVYPRKGWGFVFSYAFFPILILGGIISIIPLLTQSPVSPDLPTQVEVANIIRQDLKQGQFKNVNLAVLASDDHDVQAQRYRDILSGRDSIRVDSHDEYFHSDHLYVVSTSSEEVIRNDAAPEIANFRSGPLLTKIPIEKTDWFVYHFARY